MIRESIVIFIILLSLSGCAKKSDSQLYTEGKEAEARKDFTSAAESYEEALARFKTSAYAESSLSRLAYMYNNDIKDKKKALEAYKKFYQMFPSSKQAPTMLFLSAFIYNNEFNNEPGMLDSARRSYELFLEKYPDHELASSAKFELENLGKSPDELIKKQPPVTDKEKKAPAK
jgi:outer membrane assembly lipoprotein YfiO